MERATVRQFQANLEGYLDLVKGGEEVLVTDDGEAVARVLPITPTNDERQQMIVAGLIRPTRGPLRPDFWDLPRSEDPGGQLLAALLDQRSEER